MQPGRGSEQFERARNIRDLGWLGDPERWGGVGETWVDVPAAIPSDITQYSQQILRAQCADLVARAWELIAFWKIDGLAPGDLYLLTLETTAGSGQASGRGEVILSPAGIFTALSPWLNNPTDGTIHLPQCIPATAIAARLKLRVVGTGADPAHRVAAFCTALVAPRALL